MGKTSVWIYLYSKQYFVNYLLTFSFQFLKTVRKNSTVEVLLFLVSGFSLLLTAFIEDQFLRRTRHRKYSAIISYFFRPSVRPSLDPFSQPASQPANHPTANHAFICLLNIYSLFSFMHFYTSLITGSLLITDHYRTVFCKMLILLTTASCFLADTLLKQASTTWQEQRTQNRKCH